MEKTFQYDPGTALVKTDRGMIRGYYYDGIFHFKGVPYAKARRFCRPQPADAWEGVLDAVNYGCVCPLLELPRPTGELMVPHRYWVMDEDCLNLNIWTPRLDGGKRPVMVWLHGGGFFAGSAIEQLAYEGGNMSRNGDVVVVSVNHRLNILGYFDLSDFGEEYANSGNAGTDDLVAALRWIRGNIASFGGDPDNVTLFGQSGGGAKITALLQTPEADGLFAKGIIMSGVIGPVLTDVEESGKPLAEALLKELGLSGIHQLETVPYALLAGAYQKVKPQLEREGVCMDWAPHPNKFYLGDPAVHGFRKETSGVPLIVGSVFGEFSSFEPCPFDRQNITREEGMSLAASLLGEKAAKELTGLFETAYPERPAADLLLLDTMFREPEIRYIQQRTDLGGKVWSYLFNLDLPLDGGRTPWHCSDIPYVFHNTELVPCTQEKGVTQRVETQIFSAVMAFARTGDPQNPSIVHWPCSIPGEEYTLLVGKESRVAKNFDHQLIAALKKYREQKEKENPSHMAKNIQH